MRVELGLNLQEPNGGVGRPEWWELYADGREGWRCGGGSSSEFGSRLFERHGRIVRDVVGRQGHQCCNRKYSYKLEKFH